MYMFSPQCCTHVKVGGASLDLELCQVAFAEN